MELHHAEGQTHMAGFRYAMGFDGLSYMNKHPNRRNDHIQETATFSDRLPYEAASARSVRGHLRRCADAAHTVMSRCPGTGLRRPDQTLAVQYPAR